VKTSCRKPWGLTCEYGSQASVAVVLDAALELREELEQAAQDALVPHVHLGLARRLDHPVLHPLATDNERDPSMRMEGETKGEILGQTYISLSGRDRLSL
jgi:hypothetical protein